MEYPAQPVNATKFLRNYGYYPATVLKWKWSNTFGKWGAFVRFDDNFECYTYPMPEYLRPYLD